MTPAIRVAIIEDQRRTRECLAAIVAGTPGCTTVGSFGSMEEALPVLERVPPDIALSDIGLPGMSGIEGVRRLKASHPDTHILMLTVYDDDTHIFEAICAGASGYLLKDTPPARLVEALRELHGGGAPMSPNIARRVVTMFQRIAPPRDSAAELTPRELEVLRLLANGHSYKTAADALDISLDTLRSHIRSIYDKLHVHSKSEAVLKAFKTGLLQ